MTDFARIFPAAGMAIALAFAISGITGCAASNSSGSISDSISSPSDWSKSSSKSSGSSSDSSGGDHESPDKGEAPEAPAQTRTYQQDVTQLAYSYAVEGGDIDALRSGVSKLAAQRGLTNWEADPLTCESIGRGLARAGMSVDDFGSFSEAFFGNDPSKLGELRRGYQAGRTREG